jgi:hypothetical protein
MGFQWAADKIDYLLQEMTLKKLSGVNLKDQMGEHLLAKKPANTCDNSEISDSK